MPVPPHPRANRNLPPERIGRVIKDKKSQYTNQAVGEFISPTASVCAPGSGKAIAQSKGVHREVESEDKTLT